MGHFSAQTVVYKLARQTISSMDTAEKSEKVKWSNLEQTNVKQYKKGNCNTVCYIAFISVLYVCLQAVCPCSVVSAVAQNYRVSYKLP